VIRSLSKCTGLARTTTPCSSLRPPAWKKVFRKGIPIRRLSLPRRGDEVANKSSSSRRSFLHLHSPATRGTPGPGDGRVLETEGESRLRGGALGARALTRREREGTFPDRNRTLSAVGAGEHGHTVACPRMKVGYQMKGVKRSPAGWSARGGGRGKCFERRRRMRKTGNFRDMQESESCDSPRWPPPPPSPPDGGLGRCENGWRY